MPLFVRLMVNLFSKLHAYPNSYTTEERVSLIKDLLPEDVPFETACKLSSPHLITLLRRLRTIYSDPISCTRLDSLLELLTQEERYQDLVLC